MTNLASQRRAKMDRFAEISEKLDLPDAGLYLQFAVNCDAVLGVFASLRDHDMPNDNKWVAGMGKVRQAQGTFFSGLTFHASECHGLLGGLVGVENPPEATLICLGIDNVLPPVKPEGRMAEKIWQALDQLQA